MDKPVKEIMDVMGVSAENQRKAWVEYALLRFTEILDQAKVDQGDDWRGISVDSVIEQIAVDINTDNPEPVTPTTVRAWLVKLQPDKYDEMKLQLVEQKKARLIAEIEKGHTKSIEGINEKLNNLHELSVAELCKIEKHLGDRGAVLRGDNTANIGINGDLQIELINYATDDGETEDGE